MNARALERPRALERSRALMNIRDRLTIARERLALERSRALMGIWGRFMSALVFSSKIAKSDRS